MFGPRRHRQERCDQQVADLESREDDAPPQVGEVVAIGASDAFEQPVDAEALEDAGDRARREVGEDLAEGLVLVYLHLLGRGG